MISLVLSVLLAQAQPPQQPARDANAVRAGAGLLLAQLPPPPPTPRAPVGQVPVRDARPRTGTGVIAGRVIAEDTGLPLHRATVMLSSSVALVEAPAQPGMSPMMRTIATDAEGRFLFTKLPAATYHVRVTPGHFRAQYLTASYGGRRRMGPGRSVELKDGQQFDVGDVRLPRGGAITGRVVDDAGEPVARVDVAAALRRPGGYEQRSSGPNQTDDLGRFRIYGLEPGEYVVSAVGRGVTSYGGPPVEGVPEGFMTTYAPAALVPEQAQRVRVEAGADSGDVQIQLVRTRTFRIAGTVLDSHGRPSTAAPMLARRIDVDSITSNSMAVGADGAFSARDVLPGEYTIVVRPDRRGGPPGAPGGETATRLEFAEMPISVSSDVEDIVVVTRPGVTISGLVVLEDGSTPSRLTNLRVSAQPGPRTMSFGSTASAVVGRDLTFTLTDLFGAVQVRLAGVLPGYAVKAVMLGSSDITDAHTEFKPEDNRRLQIVVTSRVAALEGTVAGDAETPPEGVVLLFPDDRESWKTGALRVRVSTVRDGKFSIPALLPGTYYAVALPSDGMMGSSLGAEFYEPLTKVATTVVLAEGEKRTIELRITTPPEGR